jgi:hypothetical protein
MEGKIMAATLEHDVFSRYLNTNFRIYIDESSTIEAELNEVSELLLTPGQQRFAIGFRGPKEPLLTQGTYPFEHDEMGDFELFIVPFRQDDHSTFYEAVFNRMRKGD